MKKILTIVGARPQIIKAAALSRAIRSGFRNQISEFILHTGQHYDQQMSQVFFEELEIPLPDFQLSAGGKSHGEQTAEMLAGIEKVLLQRSFDAVVVYGDTNSTLAGALAAAKLHIPVVHIEAGLRSFNKAMPEEINRIATDHCSTLLFSPTPTGIANLQKEGFSTNARAPYSIDNPGVFHCGDVMYDNTLYFSDLADRRVKLSFDVQKGKYVLVTIHRPYNTDDTQRLGSLMDDLIAFAKVKKLQLVIPIHPRTRAKLEQGQPELLKYIDQTEDVQLVDPVSFLEMVYLEKHAAMIVTDSGGVQKEAYFVQKPCVVVRTETEWVEIIENGCARLAFETGPAFREALEEAIKARKADYPPIFGDGDAGAFICQTLLESL